MNDYESKLKEIQAILQSMEGNENNEETVKLLRLQQYYTSTLQFASLITVTLTPSFHF